MRPPELAAIRAHLEQAVADIDYFLNGENERENAREEAGKLYDLMEAGWTPPKAKGRHRLTKTQYNALFHGTSVNGNPLTEEKREAILTKLGPAESLSDAGREALAFWARGGWLESSRQAAVWLRKAGETVAADGIDEALGRLPNKPRDVKELPGYRESIRTAAEQVRTILTTCLEEQPPVAKPEAPPMVAQIIVHIDRLAVTVKITGKDFDLKSEQAARWLKVLADHPGAWISGPDLIQHDEELDGARTDRLRKALPPQIRRMIETGRRGARLKLA